METRTGSQSSSRRGRRRLDWTTTGLDRTKAHARDRAEFFRFVERWIGMKSAEEGWDDDRRARELYNAENQSERLERQLVEEYLTGESAAWDRGYYGKKRAAADILAMLYSWFKEGFADRDSCM